MAKVDLVEEEIEVKRLDDRMIKICNGVWKEDSSCHYSLCSAHCVGLKRKRGSFLRNVQIMPQEDLFILGSR